MSIYFHPHQAPFIGMAVSLSNYHCYLKFHYFHSQMGGHTVLPVYDRPTDFFHILMDGINFTNFFIFLILLSSFFEVFISFCRNETIYDLFLYVCFVFIGWVSIHIVTIDSESVLKPICGLDKSSPYKRILSMGANKLHHSNDKSCQAHCLIYVLFVSAMQQGGLACKYSKW
ncbi:hypothetical protein RT761_00834 [Atribacter laminatus]|uniref:Uncharacterized protein n=1 Tax=Atribacter laminatus TaxID=2847778 RepID=A0A7T1F239_ATRLM|nr:hypothetical protein RT761_00834 [Atribacter laminatus]